MEKIELTYLLLHEFIHISSDKNLSSGVRRGPIDMSVFWIFGTLLVLKKLSQTIVETVDVACGGPGGWWTKLKMKK